MPFPTFVEKLGSLSFLGVAKEGTYGATAGSTITSNPNAATTFTAGPPGTVTDPTATYVPNALVGRTFTATSGGTLGSGVIATNTATVITLMGSWVTGTPANGAAYTISGANNYTPTNYLPVTGMTIEPDPGLFSPTVMMAQRDKNIFALYGQYKFSGGIDAPIFPSNGMALLAGAIGTDTNQYGSLPATTGFGYITAAKSAGANGASVFTVNYAGLAANSVFSATSTLSIGQLGVGQYGHSALTWTSGTNTTFSATTAVDNAANWVTNQWAGRVVTSGINAATVVSNTSNTLTTTTWRAATGGAGTPAAGAVFSINSTFASQPTSSSFNLLPAQITSMTGGGGAPFVFSTSSSAGANNGALPYAITVTGITSTATTSAATLISDNAYSGGVAFAQNALVGRIITQQTFAGVITANSASTAATVTYDVGGGWFTATTGASGGPPTNAAYTISGNNVVQIVAAAGVAPFWHSVTQSNALLPSYTIEKSLGGGDVPHSNSESEQFVGIRIGKYTIKLGATNTEAQFTADVTGRNGVVLTSPSTPTYTNENPFVFAEATLQLFGTTLLQATNVEIDIDNGLKQTWSFNQTHQLSYNTPVVRTITGKCTVVHNNLDDATYGYFNSLLQLGSNTVQGPVSLTLSHPASGSFLPGSSPSESVQISLSAVNLAKYADDVKLEDVILTNLDFTAFLNLAASPPTTISAVIANTQAFAY